MRKEELLHHGERGLQPGHVRVLGYEGGGGGQGEWEELSESGISDGGGGAEQVQAACSV